MCFDKKTDILQLKRKTVLGIKFPIYITNKNKGDYNDNEAHNH